jgi:lipoprotein-releasing system ATP-binding protein
MSLLELEKVRKSFRSGTERLVVLDDVSLSIDSGQSVVIGGESGSGKSTLLNLIAGLESVDAGSIRFDGNPLESGDEARLSAFRSTRLGLVFQFHYLLKDFSALENVMLPAFLAGVPRAAATERAEELLAEVGLSERLSHFPSQLSGGERQRAAVARALINDPDLILADEPTGNLDELNSRRIEESLFMLASEHGTSLIVVTHDRRLFERGDFHYVLRQGRLE